MNSKVECSQSSESRFGIPRSATPPPTTHNCALRRIANRTSPALQHSVALTATISPEAKSEMIDYAELSPRQEVVSTNPVELYLALARSYTNKNQLPVALDYYSLALRIENKAAPASIKDRLLMADILYEIGWIHMRLNDPVKALHTLDLCLGIRRDLLAWDDKRTATVLQRQASIYKVICDSESAVRVLEELLGILCCSTADSKTLQNTWLELARHQDALGLHSEARSSRAEANHL